MKTFTSPVQKQKTKPKAFFGTQKKSFSSQPFFQAKLTIGPANDVYEKEADSVAEQVMRMSGTQVLQTKISSVNVQKKCAECEEEEKAQRKEKGGSSTEAEAPSVVNEALQSGSSPMDKSTQSFMENRFGYDFSGVKIHTGPVAAKSASAINALAYTSGNHVVFNEGQYAPGTDSGKKLLAHELTHVVQQSSGIQPKRIQRSPARLVGCTGPFTVPVTGKVVADPVQVITDAETKAQEMMDLAIGELEYTRNQIIGGAGIGWPTISDTLAHAIRVMGLDPDSAAFWRNRGLNTAHLLLRRLKAIRGTINGGGIFYHCATQSQIIIGDCRSRGCVGAEAESCAGSFHIILCQAWWDDSLNDQASTLIHEHAHNFAAFIQDSGREGNAECYTRFVQILNSIPENTQRLDLCPNP